MPARIFWLLSRHVDRHTADEDLRQVTLMRASQLQDKDAWLDFTEGLRRQMGEISHYDDEAKAQKSMEVTLDRGGLDELRALQ